MATTVLHDTSIISTRKLLTDATSRLFRLVRDLNFFSENPFWSSTLTFREQIHSTRLFLLFIYVSMIIVIGYSSLQIRTHEITLKTFSLSDFERLEKLYPSTINVPCDDVTIPYNKFLDFSPQFHQVCQSPFIQRKWISSLFLFNATSHNILDYRTFAFSHFRALGLLCRISRQAIKDILRTFNSTHFVHRQTLSRIQFNEIASVLSNNLQQNVINNEKRTARIISLIIAQNRIFSALRTNYYIQSVPGSRSYSTYNGVYLYRNQTNEFGCDCKFKANQCTYPAGAFYNWTLPELGTAAKNNPLPQFQIPGLMAGCLPLDSMQQSTLECLYNQSCINAIALRPNLSQPKALNSRLTRFLLNSTIGSIFDESLFVESWKNKSNYENYFAACSPRSLYYSYQSRFHLGTILTISLSAFGGLIIIWQLITPVFIKIWNLLKEKTISHTSTEHTQIELAIINVAPKPINEGVTAHVHRTIHNFNLFPPNNKNDKEEERIGIITTRLYIFLIVICLIVLGLYTCLTEHNQTRSILSPSLNQFKKLNSMNLSTLNCPCSNFSMSYSRIMTLSPRYHSICSSEYLQDDWLSYFGRVEIDIDSISFLTNDFRVSGQSFFDLVRILCQTANETIENALKVFKTTRLVTVNTLTPYQFHIETNTHFQEFQQQTINSFIDLIQLIRSLIQTNQLAEELWTNVGPLSIYDNQTLKWSFAFRPRDFYKNSCSCAYSNQCSRPVGFYFQGDTIRDQPNITVPGLFLGCYPIDSLLLSTFQCFYDEKCIKLLLDNYDFDVVGLVRPLNNRTFHIKPLEYRNSRFSPTTEINEIFSQLFVEEWINLSNFTSYYTRCAPSQCTYTISKRFDVAYAFTIMLGFYGGLSVILEILLLPLVKQTRQRWFKLKTTDNTNTDTTINSLPSHCNDKLKFQLNFFKSDPPSTEEKLINQEILATRLYIFVFLLCLIMAILYSGPFHEDTKANIIISPSLELVNKLHKRNISSLSCPCSTVAIQYSNFLSLTPKYHSICSNKSLFLNFIDKNDNISLFLFSHYRLLSTLCNLSNNFINSSEKSFGTRELITIETLTYSSFHIEINALISIFISQILSDYRRILSFIDGSFNVNQLLNLFTNNWKMEFTDESEKNIIRTFPRKFTNSNCNCAISSNCKELLIDDIYIGCFPYDGFRLSKFQNISLGLLNEQLFVEQWINQTNYTSYFQACNPLQCQYTSPDKNNPMFILTTLLGLYGGLTYFLHLIIGQSLLAYRWWRKKRIQQHVLVISNESATTEIMT
ncbi:unnamed protein product [Adineta steineri]|uniref:Uncharacterized protein n=1 Tax=Adineta steineri TaxID=433720 RepID=A0A813RNM9_9BILA|nr:unnamed protein product [Adineta steineri]CAF0922948.1 unnamed protein product [Adineta steineri]